MFSHCISNSLPASCNCCRIGFLKEFFEKVNFEKSQQTQKRYEKLPSIQKILCSCIMAGFGETFVDKNVFLNIHSWRCSFSYLQPFWWLILNA